MPERSLGESISDKTNIVVAGKGGVGKSTVSASLAYAFSQKALKTIAVDMDASHSLGDSLGLGIDEIGEGTSSFEYSYNLKLYFLSKIIPDIYNDDEKHTKLNYYLDKLMEVEDSFLPLLRLAIHPSFVGMPLPYENAAYVAQLIDLFRKNSIYTINDDQISRDKFEVNFDKKVLDTENTQGFIRVINAILHIQRTLKNIHKSFYGTTVDKIKNTMTREGIKGQDNLHKFALSDLVARYKDYKEDMLLFHQDMVRASVIIVTQPGYNDLNQTIKDIKILMKMGFPPSHILINKYKDHYNKNPQATSQIYNKLVDFANFTGIGLSKIDSDFTIIDPSCSKYERENITKSNLENIAQTFQL